MKAVFRKERLMVTRLCLCIGTMLLWGHLISAAQAVTVDLDAIASEDPKEIAEPISAASLAEISEEIPEEILRTEIITGARSPLTGEPLSADEYARLQDELKAPAGGNIAGNDIRYLIFLLQVRRAIKPIVPFIP